MKRIKVTAEFDRARAKELRKALRELPPQFRGRQIINAQKKIMKPAKDEVTRILKTKLNTTSLDGRSIQVVQGKYAKKTSPYVVVQAADKKKLAKRYREKYSSSTYTNWWKIDHIVTMGTGRGNRRAGTSQRVATAGRDRVKLYSSPGVLMSVTRPTSGRYFLVMGRGRLHPVKQIFHPGTEPMYQYDEALAKTNRAARNKFYDFVADQVIRYQQKQRGIT